MPAALQKLGALLGQGGAGNTGALPKAVRELQGLRQTLVTGAAAGTKMNVNGIKPNDHIVSAIITDFTADDAENITISPMSASGTITFGGLPADNDTVVVNGNTYRFKTAVAQDRDVPIGANANATAAALANAINTYENRYAGSGFNKSPITTTVSTNVVTVTAKASGTSGNAITLTENATNVTVSGSGTLAGGGTQGGITSTTDLSSKKLLMTWHSKP